MTPKLFEEPRALDLLTEFRKKMLALADKRVAELQAGIDAQILAADFARPMDMMAECEWMRHFEKHLNRVITAFMDEALHSGQQALIGAATGSAGPWTWTTQSNTTVCHRSGHLWGDWLQQLDGCQHEHSCVTCGATETFQHHNLGYGGLPPTIAEIDRLYGPHRKASGTHAAAGKDQDPA